MKKIGVFTSGGDAPGMNACIRAVVRTALFYQLEVVGIMHGYNGMINNEMIPLYSYSVSNIIQQGGTVLKTARSEAFMTKEGRKKAFDNLQKQGIEGLVAIGGNGTFTGAKIFYEEFGLPIIGCPGTIDNDLYGTDYTIGFDTAVNTAVDAIDKIRDTANAHDRLFFIEVMGRDTGYIALYSGIASGAEIVLIPETLTSIDEVIKILNIGKERKKTSSIVIVAEGDEEGGALEIANKVKEKFNYYSTRVMILGHLQRGGRPTAKDRILASQLGSAAVQGLIQGKKNVMAGVIHQEVVFTPFEECIQKQKTISSNLLSLIDLIR
ncbi:MAG: 6-phosphofructokinase [Bacteroidia bacterium]|nr:6-phosphofructokinase [Bacteroidia bacterium]MDW8346021.1 6-phosphofructokinase [Bacteroidia bacterium]